MEQKERFHASYGLDCRLSRRSQISARSICDVCVMLQSDIQMWYCTTESETLVPDGAIEWDAHGLQQQSCLPVRGGCCLDEYSRTGNQLFNHVSEA